MGLGAYAAYVSVPDATSASGVRFVRILTAEGFRAKQAADRRRFLEVEDWKDREAFAQQALMMIGLATEAADIVYDDAFWRAKWAQEKDDR